MKLAGAGATSGKSGAGSEGRAISLMAVGSAASIVDSFSSSWTPSAELSVVVQGDTVTDGRYDQSQSLWLLCEN